MATYIATTAFIPTFLDDNGDPLNGGRLESYIAGTTTPTPTYTGEAGVSAGNIITLNARGEPETSGNTHQVWIDSAIKYDFVLKTAAGVIINSPEDVASPLVGLVGSVASLLNIAAAKALTTLIDDQAIYIRGYTTAGDGGGGMYVYDSSSAATANDGTVLALDTLPGRLIYSDASLISDKTFGSKADRLTDDTTEVSGALVASSAVGTPTLLNTKTKHDSDIWDYAQLVDSKQLSGKGFNASLASLPRLYKKLTEYNEATSTQIKIVGMGSSVGNGAGTSDPATFSPVVQFANRFDAKFNKLGIYNIVTTNRSVDGSTLAAGNIDIASILSTEQPDVMLFAYGMNDGAAAQYNSGQAYSSIPATLKTMIAKCHEAGCDVIVCTSPHPQTDIYDFSINQTIPAYYPTSSWALTDDFSFTSGTSRIDATTSGVFTNSALGFGLTVGRKIDISGTVSNDGTYTIATIDGTGDFITVAESIITEGTVTSTVRRVAIQDSELVPTPADSSPSIDILGYGTGNEVDVSYRHYRVNQAMKKAAIESGVAVVDVEHYWFEAVYRSGGVASLYDGAEYVHPNDYGFRQSYHYGLFEFVDSLSESYVQGTQQNSILPSVSVEDVLTANATAGVVVKPSVDLVVGGPLKQTAENINVSTTVGFKGNQGIAFNVPITPDSAGKILITAYNNGIGRQIVEYVFSNNGGATLLSQNFTLGSDAAGVFPVVSSVTGSGDNIVITPVAANTNIRWQLVEIS